MFGISAHEIGLTRRLLAGLELRDLSELSGQRFTVRAIDEVAGSGELLSLLGLAGENANDAVFLERTPVGYGFIDLRFRLTSWPAELQRTGSSVVRRLLSDGSLDRGGEGDTERTERVRCLEDVCAEIDAGVRELRVMADAEGLPSLTLEERFRINTGRQARGFPLWLRDFVVRDAYITNAPTVSLNRHYYL
ncbi:MAG: hypothetical protein AB7S26_12060 [Sandaracinaceae bacterium]